MLLKIFVSKLYYIDLNYKIKLKEAMGALSSCCCKSENDEEHSMTQSLNSPADRVLY